MVPRSTAPRCEGGFFCYLGSVNATSSLLDPNLPILRLSVARYHAMRDAGILTEADRVELLGGLLVPKMTKNPPHSLATELVRRALANVVPPGWYVRIQEPVTTSDSEPEPDLAVVRGDPRDYAERHPRGGDVGIVVEVAAESLNRDRTDKRRIYAQAGIETYWVVNLREALVEVYGRGGGMRRHRRGETVAVVVEGARWGQVDVDAMLP